MRDGRYKYTGHFRGTWLGWGYQDYTTGQIASGANANVITLNSNGDNIKFSTDRIVSNTAIICRGGTDRTVTDLPVYSAAPILGINLFSTKIKVTAHTTDSVTLNATPHFATYTTVRVYFLFTYDFGCPRNYEFPSQAISGKMFDELNALMITEEELAATIALYLPLLGGTMGGDIIMGNNDISGIGGLYLGTKDADGSLKIWNDSGVFKAEVHTSGAYKPILTGGD